MKEVAIIGAGVSGLSAAFELSCNGIQPVVFEKSRGLSGRAATRRRGEICMDHGANFFRTTDPEVAHLIHETLPSVDLVEIKGDVWTFDQDSVISPGDPEQNMQPKYTYRKGISTLGKLLQAASGTDVQRQQRVKRLIEKGQQWELENEVGDSLGQFDAVIVSTPAPQAAQIIIESTLQDLIRNPLVQALQQARYDPQFAFVIGFTDKLPLEKRFHALVNQDGQHPVSWISFEDDKPGHVPNGNTVLVIQMSPSWSSLHLDHAPEQLLPQVLAQISTLMPEIAQAPEWWESQRWLLAAPRSAVDTTTLKQGESYGLFFAGDGLAGRGRLPLAIKSGLDTAKRLIARM